MLFICNTIFERKKKVYSKLIQILIDTEKKTIL